MSHLRELYRAQQLPVLQNRVFRTAEDARSCVKGDVVLVQDMSTGLVANRAFDPALAQYDTDYQNEQALSPVFQGHLDDVTSIVRAHFSDSTLIEVGCGKGFFLEHLQRLGFEITGVDPAYEGTNPRVVKSYFEPEMGLRAGGIILRHVLEHMQDPVGFLGIVREANGGAGKIYLEVPCFDWICRHRAWFDVFYEHVNYFRIDDFRRMFGRVHESGHIFGGQYLYVVADLSTLRDPVRDDGDRVELPEDFLETVDRYASRLRAASGERERRTVVWGAASKGVIFSLFMQRAGVPIDFVVDINPAKQGKYLPATGLPVSSPEEMTRQLDRPADVFVMNGNYLAEIQQLLGEQFNYLTVDHVGR